MAKTAFFILFFLQTIFVFAQKKYTISGTIKDDATGEQLIGATPDERATIRQWICYAQGEILDPVTQLALWRLGIRPYDEKTEQSNLERLERSLACLETYLQGRTWFAGGDKLSLADITVAAALVWGFSMAIDDEMRPKYPTVVSWYERTLESEGVKEAFGEKKYVEKRSVPPS